MNNKKNCWEYFHCGREPGGKRVDQLGVCPATIDEQLDGINDGKAGGRACWTVEDTLCSGILEKKFLKCTQCDFFKKVSEEEGPSLVHKLNNHHKD